MVNHLRALVVSPDTDALQNIKVAFESAPDAELTLRTTHATTAEDAPDVLVIHAPIDWLRKLRAKGFRQPAMVLTDDSASLTPLDNDLGAVENITWSAVKAGFLPTCVDMMLSVVTA